MAENDESDRKSLSLAAHALFQIPSPTVKLINGCGGSERLHCSRRDIPTFEGGDVLFGVPLLLMYYEK